MDLSRVRGEPRPGSAGTAETKAETEAEAEAEVEAEWRAAMFFVAKGPSASLQFLDDAKKVALDAFQAQALEGPCQEADAASPALEGLRQRRRREAWAALGDMPRAHAKARFVRTLTEHLPGWREWYRQHGRSHAVRSRPKSQTRDVEKGSAPPRRPPEYHGVGGAGPGPDQGDGGALVGDGVRGTGEGGLEAARAEEASIGDEASSLSSSSSITRQERAQGRGEGRACQGGGASGEWARDEDSVSARLLAEFESRLGVRLGHRSIAQSRL